MPPPPPLATLRRIMIPLDMYAGSTASTPKDVNAVGETMMQEMVGNIAKWRKGAEIYFHRPRNRLK